jgi:hypothetical protein
MTFERESYRSSGSPGFVHASLDTVPVETEGVFAAFQSAEGLRLCV